jgi:uncharacterized protein
VQLTSIRRYPVKSMGGEPLASAEVELRGLVGDRRFAVTDADGRFASGKNTRRFRRRDAVFSYAAATSESGVSVSSGDQGWPVGSPALDKELSRAFGDPVRVTEEDQVAHFDAGAISLVGSASLAWCREHLDVDTDPRRLRVNLVVETEDPFVEEAWSGDLAVGPVGLRVVERIERCRTVDLAQDGVPTTTPLLKALGADRELCLGIYLDVAVPGVIRVGDDVLVGTGPA